MSKANKRQLRLGRGLSALMSPPKAVDPSLIPKQHEAARATTDHEDGTHGKVAQLADLQKAIVDIPVEALEPNRHQPRRNFDEAGLRELAESIRAVGLMQPIIVRPDEEGRPNRYSVVAGERRWRAAKLAGFQTVPAMIRELDEETSAGWALIENLQRQDLDPIERAQGFKHLISAFGLSHEQVATHVGIQRSTITNSLRLLNLHGDVQMLVSQGVLAAGHAKAMASLQDPKAQLELAKQTIRQDWSVRRLEAAVRRINGPEKTYNGRTADTISRAAHLTDLEQRIAEQLGMKAKIHAGRKKGAGVLSLHFHTFDQFDAVLEKLGVEPG